MATSAAPPGPFDRAREGFVLGEGGFALLLETADTWGARRAPRYGEILGVGAGSAAVAINQWPDDPAPLVRTMSAAIADARLTPADIHVVYASANATPALDRVESVALGTLFGSSRPLVTSVKGALGECGASGAAACAAALLCGREGQVPPIVGLAEPDRAAAALDLVRERRDLPGPVALVTSVGSGGSIFAAVLKVNS